MISDRDEQDFGLFGYNAGTIKNLNVNGTVDCINDTGLIAGENKGTIENCHVSGSVTGSTAGGLVGRNAGIITKCTSMGN